MVAARRCRADRARVALAAAEPALRASGDSSISLPGSPGRGGGRRRRPPGRRVADAGHRALLPSPVRCAAAIVHPVEPSSSRSPLGTDRPRLLIAIVGMLDPSTASAGARPRLAVEVASSLRLPGGHQPARGRPGRALVRSAGRKVSWRRRPRDVPTMAAALPSSVDRGGPARHGVVAPQRRRPAHHRPRVGTAVMLSGSVVPSGPPGSRRGRAPHAGPGRSLLDGRASRSSARAGPRSPRRRAVLPHVGAARRGRDRRLGVHHRRTSHPGMSAAWSSAYPGGRAPWSPPARKSGWGRGCGAARPTSGSLVQSAGDAVVILDDELRMTWSSPALAALARPGRGRAARPLVAGGGAPRTTSRRSPPSCRRRHGGTRPSRPTPDC